MTEDNNIEEPDKETQEPETEEQTEQAEEPVTPKRQRRSGWRTSFIILGAVAILVGVSFLPLSELTGGRLSDINLLSDIMKVAQLKESDMPGAFIDPELQQALEEEKDSRLQDTVMGQDSIPLIAPQPTKEGELVVIEDYTVDGKGLQRLREAINAKPKRLARIAVIGDSYIEGDIITQDLREMMQLEYGGHGAGYINMHSEFPGFRRSVAQSGGSGWKEYAANKKHDAQYMNLTQHYFKLTGASTSTYKGVTKVQNVDVWPVSKFVFVAPQNAVIQTKNGPEAEWVSHEVTGSPDLQEIEVRGTTGEFAVKSSSVGLVGLGVWLTDTAGVNVDCMSSRGFSGITLNKVSPELSAQLSLKVPYDLIVLEFGINAMSASQTNYDGYGKQMVKVINHVRECYPNADILMLGIGDRGTKHGSEVHSMSVAKTMIAAQRESARHGRCLFFDTREAMGGEDAIVRWVNEGLANTDYVHLNHKGGRRLAESLFNAIKNNIDK